MKNEFKTHEHENEHENEESIQKLGELIKDIKITMLTTYNSDGNPHSRPMMTQEMEADGNLWFFSGLSSGKMFELENSPKVNLSYSSPDSSRFVSVTGTVEVVRDLEKAKELWKPMYKMWFPLGVDDPDLILLKVEIESAEYWDSPGTMVGKLIRFARKMITGQGKMGENEKIEISH